MNHWIGTDNKQNGFNLLFGDDSLLFDPIKIDFAQEKTSTEIFEKAPGEVLPAPDTFCQSKQRQITISEIIRKSQEYTNWSWRKMTENVVDL